MEFKVHQGEYSLSTRGLSTRCRLTEKGWLAA